MLPGRDIGPFEFSALFADRDLRSSRSWWRRRSLRLVMLSIGGVLEDALEIGASVSREQPMTAMPRLRVNPLVVITTVRIPN